MDPQNQQETGKFGDTTEAVSDPKSGQPVDNTDDNGQNQSTTEVKTEVTVEDNASEAAAVETPNTPKIHGDGSGVDTSVGGEGNPAGATGGSAAGTPNTTTTTTTSTSTTGDTSGS